MFALPLSFGAPAVLAALLALPVLYWLLRVTPPSPKRIDFPPLRILLDLLPEKETVARTPWWLLLLRLAIAAAIILAVAAPIWNAHRDVAGGSGPLLLLVDNGWPSAPDWRERMAAAEQHIVRAQHEGRGVALVATAGRPLEPQLAEAPAVLERLRGLKPEPHRPDRTGHAALIGAFLDRQPNAAIVWVADGLGEGETDPIAAVLAAKAGSRNVAVHAHPKAMTLALADAQNLPSTLSVRVVRAEANGRDAGTLRALDRKGAAIGAAGYRFAPGALETTADFALPLELRNEVARVEIADERSAGAVYLLDASARRRRVGVVSGTSTDTAQPLLAPTYYLSRALTPFSDLREGRGGPSDAILALLEEKPSVMILADIGVVAGTALTRLQRFVDEGGVLIRFAGNRLAAGNDDLVPVRLRRGGRSLGGALSWEAPRTLAPFGEESPFRDLKPPAEVTVTRQILAEPGPTLSGKTWAALADGTPVVTGERRGKGLVVLFHVTADTAWSNLPLSALFVDMLRVLVQQAAVTGVAPEGGNAAVTEALAPTATLDGTGLFQSPPPTARPIPAGFRGSSSIDHPPGFYGPPDAPVAVNAMTPEDKLMPLTGLPANAVLQSIVLERPVDLRPWLLALALAGFIADTLAMLVLGGAFARLTTRRTAAKAAALLLGLALAGLAAMPDAQAQAQPQPAAPAQPPIGQREIAGALVTRLAYVVTGNQAVDDTSRAGLIGLTQALAQRTALEAGEPVGVDPARDELTMYPFLYWPILADQAAPSEIIVRRLDSYMKNGGTVVFDTRDGLTVRADSPSPENRALRRLLDGLDVPALEPVPRDHVVTKAFYIIDRFPGRYDTAQAWIEALPPAEADGGRPARAGDNVTPVIITGNDLAAAWAVGRRGEPLFPLVGSDPRQREMALRGGINIVLYTLTGNYKTDQVHVPALLERLGQ